MIFRNKFIPYKLFSKRIKLFPKRIGKTLIVLLLTSFYFPFTTSAIGKSEEIIGACCSTKSEMHYSSNFDSADFVLTNVQIDNGRIVLKAGRQAIDPEKIIVPLTQEIFVTFISNGSESKTDFGWVMYDDAVDDFGLFKSWNSISDDNKHTLFKNICDNAEQSKSNESGNGIFDTEYGNGGFPTSNEAELAVYDDGTGYPFIVNGDGFVTSQDMKKSLGTLAGGTEIVFYFTTDNQLDTSGAENVYFTKTEWNSDNYTFCGAGSFGKVYHLDRPSDEDGCSIDNGWLTGEMLNRTRQAFGISLSGEYILPVTWGQKYSHVVIGVPPTHLNQWILGWESNQGQGDADHNDALFLFEQRAGGVICLKPDKALIPAESEANFNAVNLVVQDSMPCSGQTDITYYISIDGGENWVEIGEWDVIKKLSIGEGGGPSDLDSTEVAGWSPGEPQTTYRSRNVDFLGMGHSGKALLWKAELVSKNEVCIPQIINISLIADSTTSCLFSQSSPVVQTNMLYSGYTETPLSSWPGEAPRGHVVANRIYDPEDATSTKKMEIWDAGEVLNSMEPNARTIYFPDITVNRMTDVILDSGDGIRKTFQGVLVPQVMATTVRITDARETFSNTHQADLKGNFGGTGNIDQSSGKFTVTFNQPPQKGAPIKCSYSFYNFGSSLKEFNCKNVSNKELALDETSVIPDGSLFDLNGDARFDELDGDWLVQWVRGYSDGGTQKKQWLLGAVNHSVPAIATPPGKPYWYYGTDITEDEKKSFNVFIDENKERQTILYVGAGDGMLHAFDAGQFRWGDNPETANEENRGYFKWEEDMVLPNDSYSEIFSPSSEAGNKAPNYGSGTELWAFIPPGLLSKLKNNKLKIDVPASLDVSPSVADVFINGQWRTVLLMAEGNGGSGIFCLDITQPQQPLFLWEFYDRNLIASPFSPQVVQIGRIALEGRSRWVAFLASGKCPDMALDPSIYVIDIADGSLVRRVFLHSGMDNNSDGIDDGIGGVCGGQPAIIDSDGNGYIDRMYIGTDKGFLFKINIPDNLESPQYVINPCVINTDFSYEDENGDNYFIAAQDQYNPIYGSPAVVVDNEFDENLKPEFNIRIFFGTANHDAMDEGFHTIEKSHHFFAYSDTDQKGECNSASVSLDWFKALPKGHQVIDSAFSAAGTVYFGTSKSETPDPCAVTDAGRIFALNMENGSIIHEAETGNLISSPFVEDEHLYFKTHTSGGKNAVIMGGDIYNNPVIKGAGARNGVRAWKEVW